MRIKDLQWRNTITKEALDTGFIRIQSDVKVGDTHSLFLITNIHTSDEKSEKIHLFISRGEEEFIFDDLDSAKKKANEIFESLVIKEYYVID